MKRSAFTMVELVFVIVILGILAAVAVPRLAASRVDAEIARAKSDIAAIRSSIATKRAQNLMSGIASFPDLDADGNADTLFDGVLDYPIQAGKSGWTQKDNTTYTIKIDTEGIDFTYDVAKGIFTCVPANTTKSPSAMCTTLTQ